MHTTLTPAQRYPSPTNQHDGAMPRKRQPSAGVIAQLFQFWRLQVGFRNTVFRSPLLQILAQGRSMQTCSRHIEGLRPHHHSSLHPTPHHLQLRLTVLRPRHRRRLDPPPHPLEQRLTSLRNFGRWKHQRRCLLRGTVRCPGDTVHCPLNTVRRPLGSFHKHLLPFLAEAVDLLAWLPIVADPFCSESHTGQDQRRLGGRCRRHSSQGLPGGHLSGSVVAGNRAHR
ncbi:hypothetical protein PV04_02082 [Phialophora macrospora]|uniref:Uncharacterized protein n=1 Tax=Phialophora macrospora TaxID=1851006 RepID=A0A0D2D909_9EURO|nr:hypothetical protein PV04_02082 [Phialophora macrospora]